MVSFRRSLLVAMSLLLALFVAACAPDFGGSSSSGTSSNPGVNGSASGATPTTGSAISPGYQSFALAFNNIGISNDGSPSQANFDSFGYSYSAQALAAAGAKPGATILHNGLTFTWPNVPAGSPDNVRAGGQTIVLSANGDTLGFLLTGVTYSPPETGKGTVIYSDSTQQSFSLSVPNWGCSSGDQVLTLPYRNTSNGTRDNFQVCVYYASVSLQRSKTVAQVILPNPGAGLLPSLRIFAIAVGNYS